jgi:hypothetical protein
MLWQYKGGLLRKTKAPPFQLRSQHHTSNIRIKIPFQIKQT